MKNYKKILVYQYGKVGSTAIRCSTNGKYYPNLQEKYDEYILQTHKHNVAKDILSKYNDILIINIVRLPIDRNISAFYENIIKLCPNFYKSSVNDIIKSYEKNLSVTKTDKWMNDFFELFNIDINHFNFNKIEKYSKLKSNNNDILFFRFEDFDYIISNILPKYNIFVKNKVNISSKKFYGKLYDYHKKIYKVNDLEKQNIINSKITNIFYSKDEIMAHIKKYT